MDLKTIPLSRSVKQILMMLADAFHDCDGFGALLRLA